MNEVSRKIGRMQNDANYHLTGNLFVFYLYLTWVFAVISKISNHSINQGFGAALLFGGFVTVFLGKSFIVIPIWKGITQKINLSGVFARTSGVFSMILGLLLFTGKYVFVKPEDEIFYSWAFIIYPFFLSTIYLASLYFFDIRPRRKLHQLLEIYPMENIRLNSDEDMKIFISSASKTETGTCPLCGHEGEIIIIEKDVSIRKLIPRVVIITFIIFFIVTFFEPGGWKEETIKDFCYSWLMGSYAFGLLSYLLLNVKNSLSSKYICPACLFTHTTFST